MEEMNNFENIVGDEAAGFARTFTAKECGIVGLIGLGVGAAITGTAVVITKIVKRRKEIKELEAKVKAREYEADYEDVE